ncbi:MAG: histidinol dehydrogenase, partial [Actinomycetota bacterium]|nr:histidinol dehydrogenase [Actinomycetota bacterium]
MLTRLDLRGCNDLAGALAPPSPDADAAGAELVAAVREIMTAVRAGGDAAVRDLTERFDGCRLDDPRVPVADLHAALDAASPELRAALDVAAARIREYHALQVEAEEPSLDRDGVSLHEVAVPVARAGLYVPGGRAAYPSTVLMTAIPAQLAGVAELVLCVPPAADGRMPQATLAAAALVGITEVYRIGGAQAIAAQAYGTETGRPVEVIVGPGNIFVALAKREVAGIVGIESFAGPSEVVVVADGSVPAAFAAADLLAQAEHGPGGSAVLVAWDAAVIDDTITAVEQLVADATRRDEIVDTLRTGGRAVLVDDAVAAVDAVNVIAPEHLELLTADPDALLPLVRNAGAVFLGAWSPAALGDYVAGVNHVLPTARTARFASALRVDTFRKHVHVVRATEAGLAALAPHVRALAGVEGLDAHAASVELRQSTPPGPFRSAVPPLGHG